MISPAKALLLASFALICAVPSPARAHGRPPSFNALRFDREDPKHIVAQATWGVAVSDDGGKTFRWVCAAAFEVDARSEDPQLEIGTDGRVLLGTFNGLLLSDNKGCFYEPAAPALSNTWIAAFARDPSEPRTLLAIETDVATDDRLWKTVDEGLTWTRHGDPLKGTLLHELVIAPSDSRRVYIGAATPGTERRFFVYRSDDGGETLDDIGFSPIEDGERIVSPLAVDPTDPDIVYAQVLHFNGDTAPERLVRSNDGGQTWTTVIRIPQITDVVISDDGQTVWTASKVAGVYRSDDRGVTFEEVYRAGSVRCLTRQAGTLYGCFDQRVAGFALARSTNGGKTWEPIVSLNEIDTMLNCPACSAVGGICPAWEVDVGFDLGFPTDDVPMFGADGGTGLPRDAGVADECLSSDTAASGSGCALQRTRPTPFALGLLLLASSLWLAARRRR